MLWLLLSKAKDRVWAHSKRIARAYYSYSLPSLRKVYPLLILAKTVVMIREGVCNDIMQFAAQHNTIFTPTHVPLCLAHTPVFPL